MANIEVEQQMNENYLDNQVVINNQNYYLNDSTDSDYDSASDNENVEIINEHIYKNSNINLDLINNEEDRQNYQKFTKSIDNNNFNLSGTVKIHESSNIKDIKNKVYISPVIDCILQLKRNEANGQNNDLQDSESDLQYFENESHDSNFEVPNSYILSTKETFSNRLEDSIVYNEMENLTIKYSMKEKEIIKNICYGVFYTSTNFTLKKSGFCMLSEEQYDHDEIHQTIIPCIHHLNEHHCYGSVWYHPKYIDRFQYVTALAEIDLGLIMKHNLQDITMKVKRSSGKLQDVTFESDNPLMFNENHGFIYRAYFDEHKSLFKDITFQNIDINDKTIIGLVESNPDIFTNDFVLKIGIKKNLDLWLIDDEREEWQQQIITKMAKFVPNLKFEFYEFDNYEI